MSYRPSPVGAGDRQGRAARQVAKSGLSAWKGEREGIRDDYEVPADNSSEAANEPKHFFRAEGSDHNDPLSDEFWDALKGFLNKTGP